MLKLHQTQQPKTKITRSLHFQITIRLTNNIAINIQINIGISFTKRVARRGQTACLNSYTTSELLIT